MNNTASNMDINERECFDAIFLRMGHDKAFSLLYQFIKNYDRIAVATIWRTCVVGVCVMAVGEHL
jgi:hypothetical protein